VNQATAQKLHETPKPLRKQRTAPKYHFGPLIEDDGVTFQLWAPKAREVALQVEGRPTAAMNRDETGNWLCWCDVGPGAKYRFVVDGLQVPDPASRFQPEDVHGPSELVDSRSYCWKNTSWRGRPWEETVLYELHPGVLGGFNGIASRLPDLAALGITAIELMPIGDFSGARNWGYDGVLPFAPDSAYGTPDELRALIDFAHGLGLMVFLDVVYNHFGPEGNFLPAYAADFFIEGSHTPWGPAIDFGHPQVRRFFTENALYWLTEFRFDGLRLDAVHAIQCRDWLGEMAVQIRARITARLVHLVVENEHNDAALLETGFDAQWNDDFHNVMHVLLTGETHAYYRDFADQPAQRLARCLAQGFIYQGEPSPNHGGKPRGTDSGHLRPKAFVAFLQNHDQVGNRAFGERLTRLADPRALRAAMALLLLCPQIPLLFMGEEAGAQQPFLFFTDFHGELGAAVRKGRRREFGKTPGFTGEAQQSAIPDPNAPETFVASAWSSNGSDASAWQALIHELLILRRRHLVPYLAEASAMGAQAVGPACVRAQWQMGAVRVLTIVCNLGDQAVQVDMPRGKPIFGSAPEDCAVPGYATIVWGE
jgi:maltooligosyltrehalose trehalohydrolase